MQKTLAVAHELHVVTMISNPRRYRSRYQLYNAFRQHMAESGVPLTTVEIAFGDRPFELHNDCIRLRTNYELWHKENALNIAISRLPSDAKYIAWVDADVKFARPDWAAETVHMLQHHPVVQPWSIAHDLCPNYETLKSYRSFGWCYQQALINGEENDPPPSVRNGDYYAAAKPGKNVMTWHSGYAWAARREALDQLGGLIDWGVVGSGDRHMAMALIGRGKDSVPEKVHPRYLDKILEWEWRAEKYVRRNLGYVNGALVHNWHSAKRFRGYRDRWNILTNNQFNPDTDSKYDSQGLLQLVDRGDDRSRRLRDQIMQYFASRNEDDIRVD